MTKLKKYFIFSLYYVILLFPENYIEKEFFIKEYINPMKSNELNGSLSVNLSSKCDH